VDILTEALRDAPQQQGAPLEVSLPPRHGIATAQDGLVTTGAQLTPVQEIMPPEHDVLSPGDAAAAAPMLRNLSLEDVTPVLSQTRNDHPPVGSLLDFVLPDAFPPAPPESREPEQDAKDLPATRPDETPEEEQNAPEAPKAESEDAKGAPEHLSGQEDQPESRESEQDSKGLPGARPDDRLEEKQGAPERESENANRQDTPEQLPKSDAPESEAEHLPKQETPKPKAALKLEITPRPKAAPKPKTTPKPEVVPEPEVAPADESEKNAGQAREPISFFSLPGLEGEVIDVSVLPLTPGLVFSLQEIMREIRQSAERDQSILIQEAAGRMAGKAEAFGLVKLGRLAHCVERAAEANDMEAVRTLLEDLGPVVVRYVQSLQECFNAYLYTDR
jgi:HPt (histidine-containing phosphotransfer) domain-containing protein